MKWVSIEALLELKRREEEERERRSLNSWNNSSPKGSIIEDTGLLHLNNGFPYSWSVIELMKKFESLVPLVKGYYPINDLEVPFFKSIETVPFPTIGYLY